MRLVEQHLIQKDDPRYAKIDAMAFASKNLWNAANYLVRQSFLFQGCYLDNVKVFHLIKSHEAYQGLLQLHKAWTEPPTFSGRRLSRGMYQASGKRMLNADVNGSYNIARKVFPTAFGLGIEASAVRPRRLAV